MFSLHVFRTNVCCNRQDLQMILADVSFEVFKPRQHTGSAELS